MSYLIPRAGLDGHDQHFRKVYEKGGFLGQVSKSFSNAGKTVSNFAKDTIGSVTHAVDTGLHSVQDVVNPVVDSVGLKDVRTGLTDAVHAAAPIVDTVAKFTPMAPLAYAYDAYDAGRRYGDTGNLGDLAAAGVNTALAGYGMPGTDQTGFMNGNPDGGLGSALNWGDGAPTGVDAGGTTGAPVETPTPVDVNGGAPQTFDPSGSQGAAPVETPTPVDTGQRVGPEVPTNTGSDWSNYTVKGLKGLMGGSGMGTGLQTYGYMKGLGNLYGAYQAQQRQGQLNDLYNQQKGMYDQQANAYTKSLDQYKSALGLYNNQMNTYNDFTNKITGLNNDPSSYFNSPEYQALNATRAAELARKDAASGRRSQYGSRSNQLNNLFLQNLQSKLSSLNALRGNTPVAPNMPNAPSTGNLSQMLGAQIANQNSVGQNLAGAGAAFVAPQLSGLFDFL